ncbi:NAD(P)-dependent oxidoreductase [Bradyrhizobium sp. 33ap4]|uniref:NAD(P)-dependent oxidoreductase n=1 Tax=Bradyrhizobium sp. 33ap4 TaxID=3061630 RepID=UPI003977E067
MKPEVHSTSRERLERTRAPRNPVTVAVLGASGRLGRFVVQSLLVEGHWIRALVHRRPVNTNCSRLVLIHGDAHDPVSLLQLLTGADVVVSTLGSAEAEVADVCTAAAVNLVLTMPQLRLSRLVATTGSATREDREIGVEHPHLLARRAALMPQMSDLILDGEAQMRALASSNLAWTIIRLPRMVMDYTGRARLASAPAAPWEVVGYGAAATAIVAELFGSNWAHQAPFAVPT